MQLQLLALPKTQMATCWDCQAVFSGQMTFVFCVYADSPTAGSPTATSGATAATTSPLPAATGTAPLPAASPATNPGSAATSTGDGPYVLH